MAALNAMLLLLALLGALALGARGLAALLRAVLAAAEATHVGGLAEVSARRGDLTEMAERRGVVRTARRRGTRQAAWAGLWLLLLLAPPFLGVAREVYAAAAVLWLFPPRGLAVPAHRRS